MPNTKLLIATLALALVSGCKKHSSSCEKAVELTDPWKGYGLPIEDARVCESSNKEVKIEFHGKDQAKHLTAIGEKLTAAGFPKKEKMKCDDKSCAYGKDKGDWINVLGNTLQDKWVKVTLIYHAK
jgi:hypothetical protein